MILGPLMDLARRYYVISDRTAKTVQYFIILGLNCMHTKLQVNTFTTEKLINF